MDFQLHKIGSYVLDTLYPNLCPGCAKTLPSLEDTMCVYCELSLPITNYYLEKENPVAKLFWGRLELRAAASYMVFNKKGLAQKFLHQLKYNNNKQVGQYLGQKFARTVIGSEFSSGLDGIIPLPLHKKKLLYRGYNQSEEIAKGMCSVLKIPILNNSVIRLVNNVSQTTVTRDGRQENVKDIFGLLPNHGLEGKNILVIDDTITTGATLEAIGNAILKNTNCNLSVAALASVV